MPRNFTGTYHRRSVEKDVEEFEGWEVLLDRYDRIKRGEGFKVAQVYGEAFLTGGRIGEVLASRPKMFTFKMEPFTLADFRVIERPVLEVRGMSLEKRYKKKTHQTLRVKTLPTNVTRRLFGAEPDAEGYYSRRTFVTEKINAKRKPFDIPLDEVPKSLRIMHEDLKWYLSTLQGEPARFPEKTERGSIAPGWVFPSNTKRGPMTPSYIWKKFTKYGIFPHYLRAQRMSCLITWNGLTMEQAMEWMCWENWETAMRYGKMGKSKLLGVFKRYE